jgi:murein tripeptide amidase MpaA
VCGLPLWMITIGRDQTKLKKKPVIVITSRVHSGETPASLVFKGMVEFLLSDRKEAKLLRLYYTFILIPCLNPDGVVCGNYRNSASGVDLNRQWINPDE